MKIFRFGTSDFRVRLSNLLLTHAFLRSIDNDTESTESHNARTSGQLIKASCCIEEVLSLSLSVQLTHEELFISKSVNF